MLYSCPFSACLIKIQKPPRLLLFLGHLDACSAATANTARWPLWEGRDAPAGGRLSPRSLRLPEPLSPAVSSRDPTLPSFPHGCQGTEDYTL